MLDASRGSTCAAFPSMIQFLGRSPRAFRRTALSRFEDAQPWGKMFHFHIHRCSVSRSMQITSGGSRAAGQSPLLGSLPCLFTMREESAFGYMTKVTLVAESTGCMAWKTLATRCLYGAGLVNLHPPTSRFRSLNLDSTATVL